MVEEIEEINGRQSTTILDTRHTHKGKKIKEIETKRSKETNLDEGKNACMRAVDMNQKKKREQHVRSKCVVG